MLTTAGLWRDFANPGTQSLFSRQRLYEGERCKDKGGDENRQEPISEGF